LIGIMATGVEVGGAVYSKDAAPLEGRSLISAVKDRPIEREALYWEHEGNRAVRVGDWKAVAKGPGAAWELYDVAKDRVEGIDLAAKEPARLKELVGKWERYARRANVLPWIWKPEYGAK